MLKQTKKVSVWLLVIIILCVPFAGCASQTGSDTQNADSSLQDGVYRADFNTDSSMFHVNEANQGKGILKVEQGKMTIHVSLVSKKILNLFIGLASDAEKEGAVLLQPTTDTVNYSDGTQEEVYGFDIPVPKLDEEFDCAIIGEKGVWYDHKVSVSNPEPWEEKDSAKTEAADGHYRIDVSLSGGSGKASVDSPAELTVENGKSIARIVWSSPHYTYMEIDGTRYEPVQTEGNSTFDIPVILDQDMPVSACTTAMSEPHVIEYTLRFDSATMK